MGPTKAFWAAEQTRLADLLRPLVQRSAEAGVASARLMKSANQDVLDWLDDYIPDLAAGITETTADYVSKAIQAWIDSGAPLDALVAALEPVYGATRAEAIAVTEVTRAFHQGNVAAWQEDGSADAWRFMTVQDDMVCDICAPLDGQEFALDDTANAPPQHPRCRCYSQPVVHY